jgi:PAS domain S-box-containing protein
MSSLPTLPRRSWLERCSLVLAFALSGIGAVTMLAWWFGWVELLQPLPDKAALQMNAALCFAAVGGVLVALETGRRRYAIAALLPAVLAAITLLQYVLGRNLGIDELLVRDHLLDGNNHPGRMAPVVAAYLLAACILLIWRANRRAVRGQPFTKAVVGSVLAGTGLSALLGYSSGLPAMFFWGTETTLAPVAALCLLLLGVALVLRAWRNTMEARGEAPAWSPMPWVVGALTLTMILWAGLRDRELAYARKTTQAYLDTLVPAIQFELENLTNRLERLARKQPDTLDASPAWQSDALEFYQQWRELGCISIALVNPAGRTVWVAPTPAGDRGPGFDHFADRQLQPSGEYLHLRRLAMEDVNRTGAAVVSSTTRFAQPGGAFMRGAVIYAPVRRGDTTIGYFAAELAYGPFFKFLTSKLGLDDGYHVEVRISGETVHQSFFAGSAPDPDLTIDRSSVIANRRIDLSLAPSAATLAGDRSYPELALFAGFGISLLLGLSVHLARSARAGQRAAELSNKRLFAENEERRRVEARLQISDERLRLALDSTQIGIFEWSVAAAHVYYSPALWAMLGYDHTRLPSTVEAWQSLIHPDDLPLYRRRTDLQLNGIASFIEPEYRVRAQNGDWRWVYTRAKSVATDTNGRPTRIIGTVQDITARREAEIALRESQAEARKLSLVAAKTDNPVLIGAPDGRIEWVNEAFCRVMEYSLDEVVGRNPAQFLLGPDSSPRTIARIRAAMMRGQGISTDVVNYSKSGRKYHLHIEVQPVHRASGELQNFIAVQTDITSRVETELQLRRAKADADEASRAKSDFLASMSHEIRTPMNGVIGMTSLLMETSLTSEQRDYVSTIRTSGEALLTIINDILDFSKIESGMMELESAPFELAMCIEEALDLFALQASSKHLEIGYHLAPDVPAWIMGDVTRLRQVLVNLVNNAVKFTPEGSISVEVRRVHEATLPQDFMPGDLVRVHLEFVVRDTGIGIPPDRIDRLFKAFSQVDSSTTRKYGGTGLGLAISQRLCLLMGGGIRVESPPGGGSAFIFTVQADAALGGSECFSPVPPPLRDRPVLCIEDHPITQARLKTTFEKWQVQCIIVPDAAGASEAAKRLPQAPALLVVDAAGHDGVSVLERLAGVHCPRLALYRFGQTPPPSPDDRQPFATVSKPIRTSALQLAITGLFQTSGHRPGTGLNPLDQPIGKEIPLEVLLAEDNAVNQKVALRFLERLGYRAEAVANGFEVLTALEKRRYDLILMDLQMPEMDGFEATRQIRTRLARDRQPKIVALTANVMQDDRGLCEEAGMDDHISKPVKMHEIAAAIRRHFGKPREIPFGEQLIG